MIYVTYTKVILPSVTYIYVMRPKYNIFSPFCLMKLNIKIKVKINSDRI